VGHADSGLASGDILAATRIQPGVSTWQEVVMLSEATRTLVHEALAPVHLGDAYVSYM
jgi:hypothetical protein